MIENEREISADVNELAAEIKTEYQYYEEVQLYDANNE